MCTADQPASLIINTEFSAFLPKPAVTSFAWWQASPGRRHGQANRGQGPALWSVTHSREVPAPTIHGSLAGILLEIRAAGIPPSLSMRMRPALNASWALASPASL